MKSKITYLILFLTLFSCTKKKEQKKNKTHAKIEDIDSIPISIENDTLAKPIPDIPLFAIVDTIRPVQAAVHHGEQVWEKAASEDWVAIVKRDTNYILKYAQVRIDTVQDIIVDNEGEKTGEKFVVENIQDNIYLLLPGIKIRKDTILNSVNFNNVYNAIRQNDTMSFYFDSIKYSLSVVLAESEYQIILTKFDSIKGNITQILDSKPRYGDGSVGVLWFGDLNFDGELDLIIDIAEHYNMSRNTLYLSNPDIKELVEQAGTHMTSGC